MKINIKDILKKLEEFITAQGLRGGLEISDTDLRFVNFEGGVMKSAGVRLAPGVLQEGRVKDKAQLVSALRDLRGRILGAKAKRQAAVSVVVSLSSVNIYTQVFKLPVIEGENLEKAVQLNMQMASPTGSAESYSGWQAVRGVNESDTSLEVVTAFLSKGVADEISSALREGGFMPLALESRAFSFARLVKDISPGLDAEKSLIVVSIDAAGIDVMIVRSGHLHFDYFNSWKNLQGEEKQISLDLFKTMVMRSVNQVINFYNSHWKDSVPEVLIASTGLKEEVMAAVRQNFDLKVGEFTPPVSPPVTPEWFVALGCAIRSIKPRREDNEVSLLGISAFEEFRREQIQGFLGFWKVLVPASLAVLLAAFAIGYFSLARFSGGLEARVAAIGSLILPPEAASLRVQASDFNLAVNMVGEANKLRQEKSGILTTVLEITNRREIRVSRMEVRDLSLPVTLQGLAKSEEDITGFKNELAVTTGFKDIQLPLQSIKQQGEDYYFSMSFLVSP